jgi:uncharacterized protein YciW
MNNQKMRELLADKALLRLAEQYEPGLGKAGAPGMADRLSGYAGKLAAERFVVPIAGIQGSGKSTLLNALAFETPVLPIDADETTCVPVEIAWAAQSNPHATVHYEDGRTEALPCTEDGLRSVVHNENNPGNEKRVTRVVLTSNREIFRHGLVLVDLPGVGSLTQANMETTRRYLAEAVGVIFMLRTVPPLTRSEATFVSLQWSSLRTALFVQNRWNDETDEEAHAGRDHNLKVLQQIAAQARIRLDKQPSIRLVNGYAALRAMLNQDVKLADFSGLTALQAELGRFGDNWSSRVAEDVRAATGAEIDRLATVVDQRLEETRLDRKAHQARMADETRRFNKRLDEIEERADQMRSEAGTFRRTVRQQLRKWSGDKGAELRNRMRTKMRAGIVDGPRLARALTDEQEDATNEIFCQIQEDALTMQDSLRTALEGLDAWSADAPNLRFTVNKEEANRYENLAGRLGAVGGGAGGMYAGAQAGALLGSALGPVGTVIGGLAGGLLGALAGQYIGDRARDGVTYLRASAVEGEVFEAIDQYTTAAAAELNQIAEDFCERLESTLADWRTSKSDEFEQERQRSKSLMEQSSEEKARTAETLLADKADIDKLRNQLNEVKA